MGPSSLLTRAHILCWHIDLKFYEELIIYVHKGVQKQGCIGFYDKLFFTYLD